MRTPKARELIQRTRASVMARLMLTLAIALVVAGTFQFFFVGEQVRRKLISEEAQVHAADARTLEQRSMEAAGTSAFQLSEGEQVVSAIASRPDIKDVVVVDRDGAVLIGSRAGQVGTVRSEPQARQAVLHGLTYAGVASPDGTRVSFIVPVRLSGSRYALVVDTDAAALASDVSALRILIWLFVLVSLIVALPLFYLLGGRRLALAHKTALRSARRDGLTDLDNHRAFQDELERALAESVRYGTPMTLALIDIDDFKFENDRHGHQHGDRILCELASVLRDGRAGDRAFRLGGDEFALLLPHTGDADADMPLQRLRTEVRERLGGVSASVGFSSAAPGDREASTLWGRADAALLEAKRRGGDSVVAAAEVLDSVPVVTIEKVRAVRALIARGAPAIHFQPIWDLGGHRVLGYEALARFDAPELNGPGEAFEVADSIGRGHELDAVCRRAALAAASALPDDVLLFVNLSPQTLEHDGLAGDSLVQAVRGAGLEPERVVLEITERTDARMEILRPETERLRALGFKLALDDVGAGNAGLEMLRALPVEFIKVDRGVVSAAVEDRSARAVLLGIMAFARELDAFVIAEGIETEAMLELARDPEPARKLVSLGAQGAQGYLLGRPSPSPAAAPVYGETLSALTKLTTDRERRRVAEKLRSSEGLYRVLVRNVPDLIVALYDRDLRCHLVEGPAAAGMGAAGEALEGHTVWEALPEQHATRLAAMLRAALAGEQSDFQWATDEIRWDIHAVPIEDEHSGTIGVALVCRETTLAPSLAAPEPRRRATGAPAPLR